METLLICLLLLYNVWLVTYILFGRRKKNDASIVERPPTKPPKRDDGIVGKSHFKMESKPPITANEPPITAIEPKGEVITDIDATFADEVEETPTARLPDDRVDEAFEDIRSSDVPREYEDEQGERPTAGQYATGASFEEIGGALKTADNPSATPQEKEQAGEIFSEMKDSVFYIKLTENNSERDKRIKGLMDEILNQPISGEGEAVKVSVQPQNKAEVKVPDDISRFDIRDFV